jgi:hypothetical protein
MMAAAVPSDEEPPYPDFFNHRIQKAIHELQPAPVMAARQRFSIRTWLMPLAACAGMVLAFLLGTKQASQPEIDVTGAPRAIPVEPIIYTPEKGVEAEWFSSSAAMATVIVLNGVQAIPDSTDFSHTVYLNRAREIDSTAGTDSENTPLK